jgi:hypothetical protein
MCQLSMHHPYPATKPRTRPMKHSHIGTHPNGVHLTDRGVRLVAGAPLQWGVAPRCRALRTPRNPHANPR